MIDPDLCNGKPTLSGKRITVQTVGQTLRRSPGGLMPRFLIDANLPYRFSLWRSADFAHVFDIGDDLPDSAIWQYAAQNNLVIITKDADFSTWRRALARGLGPKAIH